MGLISSLIKSFSKSKKLKTLQEQISPPLQSSDDLIAWTRARMAEGTNKSDRALEEYLNLCESDENIAKVQIKYQLSREDLKTIYEKLSKLGLGWINGHQTALSTIAYAEPLIYVIESEKRGTNWADIQFNLFNYWNGKIPQGQLIRLIR